MMGFILGLYRDSGEENGKYYITMGFILGLYRDSGKENGNYYLGKILGLSRDYRSIVMEQPTCGV